MFFHRRSLVILAIAISSLTGANISYAGDITSDSSTGTRVNRRGNVREITGGRQAGNNLFHSFKEFSVLKGAKAYFNNNSSVANIFSRVTGGNLSKIEGLIKANNANLILINPNGIIFSQGARLQLGNGSFIGTTGEAIIFKDGTTFSAKETTTPLLTISTPIGIKINGAAAPIKVNNTTLKVDYGETLALIGGNLNLNGGILKADDGRIDLGGLSEAGVVELEVDFSSSYPVGIERGDVFLKNSSFINVLGSGAGNISINARDLKLSGSSRIFAGVNTSVGSVGSNGEAGGVEINTKSLFVTDHAKVFTATSGKGDAGEVVIEASDIVSIDGKGSRVGSIVTANTEGNAGGVEINAKSLNITNRAKVFSQTQGTGNAGDVEINASQVTLKKSSWVPSQVGTTGVGNAGGIRVTTKALEITNKSALFSGAFGKGNTGEVVIEASDIVSIDGSGSFIGSVIYKTQEGNAGGVEINTKSLNVTNGATVYTQTYGKGEAGAVVINASDKVTIDGSGQVFSLVGTLAGSTGVGNAGGIEINTKSLEVNNGALYSSTYGKGNAGAVEINASQVTLKASSISSQAGVGNAGGIEINTKSLELIQGSALSSSTSGEGNAGDIVIKDSDKVSIDGGSFVYSQVGTTGVGNAGRVEINTKSLNVTNGAKVYTLAYGKGDAGAVVINASDKVTIDGSNTQVSSQVKLTGVGNAGGVEINAKSLNVTDNAQINNSTSGKGDVGGIEIKATDKVIIEAGGTIASLQDTPGAEGNAGTVNITAKSLEITSGGIINAGSVGKGDAGDVVIQATDLVKLDGDTTLDSAAIVSSRKSDFEGNAGEINITTGALQINGTSIRAETYSKGKGGNININARSLEVTNNGDIATNTYGEGKGGDINVKATSVKIINQTFDNPNTLIQASTFGKGDGGTVEIEATSLELSNGGGINTGAYSFYQPAVGSGGNIEIEAPLVSLSQNSNISANAGKNAENAGKITIAADSLKVNGSQIQASTSGKGQGGDINIKATSLEVTKNGEIEASTFGEGDGGNINIKATSVKVSDQMFDNKETFIQASTFGEGDGGTVKIETTSLEVSNKGQISTRAEIDEGVNNEQTEIGSGGNIEITASLMSLSQNSEITASADKSAENAGKITIAADSLKVNRSQIQASTSGKGKGGNININATSLEVTNNGEIAASTSGEGDGGTVKIDATSLEVTNGVISSKSEANVKTGDAGDIIITASKVKLSNGDLTTYAGENAKSGGDITIKADPMLAFGDSDILAYSLSLNQSGGNIKLPRVFFGEGYYGTSQGSYQSQNNNNRVDVNATGAISGPVYTQDLGLVEVSDVSIDTDALIANSCLARSKKKQGSFVLIGTGGLPYSPGLIPSTGYPTTEVQSTPDSPASGTTEDLKEAVEPLGVYQLESGEMILGRECQ